MKVTLDITSREVKFRISDFGGGFNSAEYLEIDPNRAVNTHGRGIAIARLMSFDELEFNSVGNEVIAVVRRKQLDGKLDPLRQIPGDRLSATDSQRH